MATLLQKIPVKAALNTRSLLWLFAVVVLAALLAVLTRVISDNPMASQDVRVMDWIVGWDLRGLTTYFEVVSFLTGTNAAFIYGPSGIIFLLLLGKTRPALVFVAVGVSIIAAATAVDYSLGQIVERGRPLAEPDASFSAFPSGHVLSTTVSWPHCWLF